MMGTVMFAEIQRNMPGLDVFSLPSARAILPYVGEGLLTKERTEDGILVNIRHGLPIPGVSSMMLTMPVFAFWTVRASRARPLGGPAGIQINQHVPKPPAEKIRPPKIVRSTAS